MNAAVAILIGVLITAALAYDPGRLVTPRESRWPGFGGRVRLEVAERSLVIADARPDRCDCLPAKDERTGQWTADRPPRST